MMESGNNNYVFYCFICSPEELLKRLEGSDMSSFNSDMVLLADIDASLPDELDSSLNLSCLDEEISCFEEV